MKELYVERFHGKERKSVYAFPVVIEMMGKSGFRPTKKWSVIFEDTSKTTKSNPKGQKQFYVKNAAEANREFNRLKRVI